MIKVCKLENVSQIANYNLIKRIIMRREQIPQNQWESLVNELCHEAEDQLRDNLEKVLERTIDFEEVQEMAERAEVSF